MSDQSGIGRLTPGFFGKVPARGDFLSRRVPAAIAAGWESWLQSLTVAVRDCGERGWQDAWLTAPLWHFVLGRRLAGDDGAAGVLIASADRVGRLFPFTLIAAAGMTRLTPADWLQQAETLALSALDDTFDPEAFDAVLTLIGPPPPPRGENRRGAITPLALDGDWPVLDDKLDSGNDPGPDQSEWWTRGSDRVPPTRLRCDGLPSIALARAMMLGGLDGLAM